MEKDNNVIECKKNEKGNYYISSSPLERIGCAVICIFLLLILIAFGSDILSNSYQDEKITLFLAMPPVGFLAFTTYTFFFYKLELGDMLVVREKFSLKTIKS